jgi:glycosyltransferase involved in cell wall biosynthesis
LERSLSILLPAHNAQATLRHSVAEVLDLAAELTSRFELLIIDQGSTDHTAELAHELSVRYPQVRFANQPRSSSLADAVRLGIERTTGEILLVHEGRGAVDASDLRRLWQLREDHDLVLARGGSRGLAASRSGFHLLRRDAVEPLRAGQPPVRKAPRRPNFLEQVRSLAFGE